MNSDCPANDHPDAGSQASEGRSYVIPITRANFATVAWMAGRSVAELQDQIYKARKRHQRKMDREWAISLLGKDERWFDDALAAIESIRKSLPEDMDREEKTIRLYGWIADTVDPSLLTQPMMADSAFRRADSVKLILENPSLYLKIRRWE